MDAHLIDICGERIDRPGHICAFFASPEEEYETLLPFFRDGVVQGEQILNVVEDHLVEGRRRALEADGIAVGPADAAVLWTSDTYLIDGRFDMERMVAFVEGQLVSSRAVGQRVRTCGSMAWLRENAVGTERAIEYEVRMNLLVPKFDCTFMCAYQLDQLAGDTITDIMATHPFVILNGKIRKNDFYVPPERYLTELLKQKPEAGARSEIQ